MLRVVAVMACMAMRIHGHGQWIEELGGGIGLQGVRYLLCDTINDRVLIAGQFAYADGLPVSPGVLEWRANEFFSLGCGIEWDCVTPGSTAGLGNPALALALWNGDVYLGGSIMFTRDGLDYNWLMRWDGAEWHPVPGLDGVVQSLKVIDGELIVVGWFEHAGNLVANGMAKWDGASWQEVVPVPPWYSGDPPNLLYDVEKFQGDWYVGGQIGPMNDLARWNGSAWETVDGGFTSVYSRVYRLRALNDRLYVGGGFASCPPYGNGLDPGNGIVAWDGVQWDDLGGGTCGSNNNSVYDMTFWHDTLYAVGSFSLMGGQTGHKFAKWDGQQWCMLVPSGYWGTGTPGALAVFHDSLYVAGAFQVAGVDPVGAFGKWVGGGHVEDCGVISGFEDQLDPNEDNRLLIHPSPATTEIYLRTPPGAAGMNVLVLDALGRVVHQQPYAAGRPIVVSHLSIGTYAVHLLNSSSERIATGRFIRN